MKSVLAFAIASALAVPIWAAVQTSATSPSAKPLAEVAKDEEARRKNVAKPAKVYTNSDLRPDLSKGAAPSVPTPADTSGNTTPGAAAANRTPGSTPASTPPAGAKDQAYWQGRLRDLQSQVQRNQIFADSLQSRINALMTEFVNRDDPAQRAKIEQDRKTAIAELDRLNKEIKDQAKAIADLQEEARKAGVPAGWLRPGA